MEILCYFITKTSRWLPYSEHTTKERMPHPQKRTPAILAKVLPIFHY